MADFFIDPYFPFGYFPAAYFGQGDDGNYHGYGTLEDCTSESELVLWTTFVGDQTLEGCSTTSTYTVTGVVTPTPTYNPPSAGTVGPVLPFNVEMPIPYRAEDYREEPVKLGRRKYKARVTLEGCSSQALAQIVNPKTDPVQATFEINLEGLSTETTMEVTSKPQEAIFEINLEGLSTEVELLYTVPSAALEAEATLEGLSVSSKMKIHLAKIQKVRPIGKADLIKPVELVRPIKKAG